MVAITASSDLSGEPFGPEDGLGWPARSRHPRRIGAAASELPIREPSTDPIARQSPGREPTVSICIPAYNEERNISNLLGFLRAHSLAHATIDEVLVDISGSTDGTRRIVEQWCREWSAVHIVDVAARDGLLRALDRMIQMAQGDVIIRIDADVRLSPGTIDDLVEALSASGVGIVSPRIAPERSVSPLADLVSAAEWEIHHQVSLEQPKTTLVQAFRKLPISLPANAGLEDAGLQEQVLAQGFGVRYLPHSTISIRPPPTVRGILQQRIRTIEHIRTHIRRGYDVPSTGSPRTVGRALVRVLREGQVPRRAVFLFVVVEVMSRVAAVGSSIRHGDRGFAWEAIEGTKDLDWSTSSP
jgi:hypothetical protein